MTGASLRSFVRGRGLGIAACALLGLAVWIVHAAHEVALNHRSFVSGWALVALMVFLTLYNLRKKLDFLPALFGSRHWLWAHLVLGYLSVWVFLLHTGFRPPEGVLESALWVEYVAVAVSGVFGHYISRRFPALLSDRGQEVLFERVPLLIRALRERVEELVLRAAREGDSTAIPDFHRAVLARYFSGPRDAWHHLLESRRPLEELHRGLDGLERLSGKAEREVVAELRRAVDQKSDVDYHHAHQAVLKGWLLLHVPLAYSLLVVSTLHVVLAYAFGGMR